MLTRIVTLAALLGLLTLNAYGQFYNLKQYDAGGGLQSPLVKTDLNHDGKPDIVGLSFHQNLPSVTALLGNGAGGFDAPKNTTITGIDNPRNLAVGDFNNDGNPDVAFVGTDHVTGAGVVAIMLGNGEGTFKPAQEVANLGNPNAFEGPVITGDFGGDGETDIAIAGLANLTVLLGNGKGGFSKPIITPNKFNFGPRCIAAGDFNHDGKLDLTFGQVVMLGKGNGRFQPPIAVPDGGCDVAVADVNGDGDLDLITGSGPRDVRVHLGNGTGKFTAGTAYPTGNGAGTGIAVGDFNGDGKPDIAVSNRSDLDVTILLNKGNGTFLAGKTYNQGFEDVIAGSFSGGTKLDLVVNIGNALIVLIGNGNGTFQQNLAQNFVPRATNLQAVDVNGDGKLDLVASGLGGAVQLGNGAGVFGTAIPFPSSCGGSPNAAASVAVGDFNQDGKPDIASIISGQAGVAVCLGNGNGTFQSAVVYDQGVQHQLVRVGRFTNSGHLDLALSDQNGISILLGKGDGTFAGAKASGLDASFPFFRVGDFNRDGKLDVAAITNAGIAVLPGKGDGTFGNPIVSTLPGRTTLLSLPADLRNNGKLDLVTSPGAGGGSISVLLGNGDGTFQSPVSYPVPNATELIVGDVNGDGKLDIAALSPGGEGTLDVLFGKGDGTFNRRRNFVLGPGGLRGITSGDFTGEGDLDLAISKAGSAVTLLVLLNLN
jgi:FG-GAP-like repeat